MRFPIIKINDHGHERIVGSDHHDVLFIDKKSNGLQYLNMQYMGGTQYNDGGIKFITNKEPEISFFPGEEIEMIDIVELVKIATEQMEADIEIRKKLDEMMTEYFEKEKEYNEVVQNSKFKILS